jgi:hypothetical protein
LEDPEKISDMEAVKVKNFWVCPENEKDEHEGYEKYRIAILGESHGEDPTFHRLVPRMRADRLKKWKARLNVSFVETRTVLTRLAMQLTSYFRWFECIATECTR